MTIPAQTDRLPNGYVAKLIIAAGGKQSVLHALATLGHVNCSMLPIAATHPQINMNDVFTKRRIKREWRYAFGPTCLFCGVLMDFDGYEFREAATIDRIDCRALGGTNALCNLQVICLACNREKSIAERAAVRGNRFGH